MQVKFKLPYSEHKQLLYLSSPSSRTPGSRSAKANEETLARPAEANPTWCSLQSPGEMSSWAAAGQGEVLHSPLATQNYGASNVQHPGGFPRSSHTFMYGAYLHLRGAFCWLLHEKRKCPLSFTTPCTTSMFQMNTVRLHFSGRKPLLSSK